jgi:hypothetical protein
MADEPHLHEAERLPTKELIAQVTEGAKLLVKEEIALAKTEIRANLKSELVLASGLGVAAVCALCALTLILVAAGFALGLVMPTWAALLVVAGIVFGIGAVFGALGWSKRVRRPLEATRTTMKEDVQWAKRQIH